MRTSLPCSLSIAACTIAASAATEDPPLAVNSVFTVFEPTATAHLHYSLLAVVGRVLRPGQFFEERPHQRVERRVVGGAALIFDDHRRDHRRQVIPAFRAGGT